MNDDRTDDDLLADLIADVALDVLARIGGESEPRYQFFRAFIDLANKTVGQDSRSVQ